MCIPQHPARHDQGHHLLMLTLDRKPPCGLLAVTASRTAHHHAASSPAAAVSSPKSGWHRHPVLVRKCWAHGHRHIRQGDGQLAAPKNLSCTHCKSVAMHPCHMTCAQRANANRQDEPATLLKQPCGVAVAVCAAPRGQQLHCVVDLHAMATIAMQVLAVSGEVTRVHPKVTLTGFGEL